MEIQTKTSNSSGLIYWVLDYKHFLLFSFFTQEELEETLAHVSHRFNEKVMSVLLWRDMMGQICEVGGLNRIEEQKRLEDTVAVTEDAYRENSILPPSSIDPAENSSNSSFDNIDLHHSDSDSDNDLINSYSQPSLPSKSQPEESVFF